MHLFDDKVFRAVERLRDLEGGPRAWPSVVALGHPAIAALEDVLRGRSESVSQPRRLAATAIGAIGGHDARLALRRALRDSLSRDLDPVLKLAEDEVIGAIAEALARNARSEDAGELVSALERRPNPECARVLGELQIAAAVPGLLRCLSDATAADAASEAVVRIGAAAMAGLTALALRPVRIRGYEGATSVRTRSTAVKLIGQIGGTASELPLAVTLSDPQRDVRFAAAFAIAMRNDGADVATEVLLEALADERWLVARDAKAALGAMAVKTLTPGDPSATLEGVK